MKENVAYLIDKNEKISRISHYIKTKLNIFNGKYNEDIYSKKKEKLNEYLGDLKILETEYDTLIDKYNKIKNIKKDLDQSTFTSISEDEDGEHAESEDEDGVYTELIEKYKNTALQGKMEIEMKPMSSRKGGSRKRRKLRKSNKFGKTKQKSKSKQKSKKR